MTILLDNVNADTTSDVVDFSGGGGTLYVRGDDFGGGTVEVQVATGEDPDLRFVTLTNGSFTAGATKTLDYLSHSTKVVAVLKDATNPVNVFVSITQ